MKAGRPWQVTQVRDELRSVLPPKELAMFLPGESVEACRSVSPNTENALSHQF